MGSASMRSRIPSALVLVLSVVFALAYVPDVNTQEALPGDRAGLDGGSIWARPHFRGAVIAQFLYVAAQAGIFSFFINYMTAEVHLSDRGAANLASVAFVCFLLGRVSGAALLRRVKAHRLLAVYALVNAGLCGLIVARLGWLSAVCVFLSYFFMSIMFPTIFALGIAGFGGATKRASAYLVMAIMGGAILPKLMGYIADQTNVSRSFVVPMICFAVVAYYGLCWPRYRGQ